MATTSNYFYIRDVDILHLWCEIQNNHKSQKTHPRLPLILFKGSVWNRGWNQHHLCTILFWCEFLKKKNNGHFLSFWSISYSYHLLKFLKIPIKIMVHKNLKNTKKTLKIGRYGRFLAKSCDAGTQLFDVFQFWSIFDHFCQLLQLIYMSFKGAPTVIGHPFFEVFGYFYTHWFVPMNFFTKNSHIIFVKI